MLTHCTPALFAALAVLGSRTADAQYVSPSDVGEGTPFTPTLYFNYTVSDMFGQLRYFSDVTLYEGLKGNTDAELAKLDWQVGIGGATNAPTVNGMHGTGQSTHVSKYVESNNLSIGEYGSGWGWISAVFPCTAMYAWGTFEGALRDEAKTYTYTDPAPARLDIDGNIDPYVKSEWSTPAGGLYLSKTDLPFALHDFKIDASNDYSGTWVFQGLTFTTGMVTQATKIEDVPYLVQPAVLQDGKPNPFYTWDKTSKWDVSMGFESVGGQSSVSYPTLESAAANNYPSLRFDVPYNTSFMIVNGTFGPGYHSVYVSSSEGFPFESDASYTFSPWLYPGTVFATPLDPTKVYSITFRTGSRGDERQAGRVPQSRQGTASLHSVTFYSGVLNPTWETAADHVNDTKPSAATTGSAIQNAAVGLAAPLAGVLGAAMAAALVVAF